MARIGATLVGVALATGIVQLAHPGREVLAVLAVLSAALMYLLLRTGYAISQIFVAAYVVFLLGVAGTGVTQTVRERALLTLLGGLLAMIAYAVYPAWETPRLRARLAELAGRGRPLRGRGRRPLRRARGPRQPGRARGAAGDP